MVFEMETIVSSVEDLPSFAHGYNKSKNSKSFKIKEETPLQVELEKLIENAPQECDLTEFENDSIGFQKLFSRFLKEKELSVDWRNIKEVPEELVHDYETLSGLGIDSSAAIHKMLKRLVIVKLNGGLGTSMGCKGPKSAIPIRDGLTFLDLTIQQIEHINKTYNARVPLVLMNSFSTHEESEKILRKYPKVNVHTFLQSCYPRVDKETLLPIASDLNVLQNKEAWYPPGHGNFYETFSSSGLLQQFLEEGREYCFVSNVDNLGGTFDHRIFYLIQSIPRESRPEFVMEVTDKTRADVKGGALVQYEGKLRLLEIAQVPKDRVKDFKSFKLFNTNNLWIKLDAIERVLSNGSLNMEVIPNPKVLDNGRSIIQLETAVGSAMKSFDRGLGIRVPRHRFIPVKKTSDLMFLMSDLYKLHDGYLTINPKRMSVTPPLVTLEKKNFTKVKDFLERFSTIPSIVDLDHLTVSGDVNFGKDVCLKGTVIVVADFEGRIDIPDGAVLENQTVTGTLRISNH